MSRMEETGKIVTPGESEVIIKKSRFLGYAAAAKSPEEAADIVHVVGFQVRERICGLAVMLIDRVKTGDQGDEIVAAAS